MSQQNKILTAIGIACFLILALAAFMVYRASAPELTAVRAASPLVVEAPYPAPETATPAATVDPGTIAVVYNHEITGDEIHIFQIDSKYVLCSLNDAILKCIDAEFISSQIDLGEIHLVTAAGRGYVCTTGGCVEFSY